MIEDYNYYKNWINRYTYKKKLLTNLPVQTHKVKYLIQEMKYFIWMLEHRMECFRHYDVNAKSHPSYPICLDWRNYRTKEKRLKNEK